MKKDEATPELVDVIAYEKYKAFCKANPNHIIKTHYETFQSANLSELRDKLNTFSDSHEVIHVDIKPHSFSQKGTMLCDRINPYSDTATIYLATVAYLADVTLERTNEAMEKWVVEKVKAHYGNDYDKYPNNYFNDVETGRLRSTHDIIVDFVTKLHDSPEFEKQRKLFIEKYSIPKTKKE